MNVAGCKLWRLLAPQHTHLLYDRFGRELAPDFGADAARPGHFPNLAAARKHVIEVVQVDTTPSQFEPSSWSVACHTSSSAAAEVIPAAQVGLPWSPVLACLCLYRSVMQRLGATAGVYSLLSSAAPRVGACS